MSNVQPGILAPVPPLARYLFFTASAGGDHAGALRALRDVADGDTAVVGLGLSLIRALGRDVPGLHDFPVHTGPGFEVPATPDALWCWLRGDDRGDLVHRTRRIEEVVARGLHLTQVVDAFRYRTGFDLTGYEDGTENPKDDAAIDAAVAAGQGPGFDGASFVAVQQWVHDLDAFAALSPDDQDHAIGRRKSDNEEIEDAPPSAHVKRTAQESFDPEAFVLRRSMPWADENEAGLVFVAFGKSVAAYEAQLRRMAGAEDGIPDALFRFSRPVTGAYFWCPPMLNGRPDLRAVGL